jgi:hypothetical protein
MLAMTPLAKRGAIRQVPESGTLTGLLSRLDLVFCYDLGKWHDVMCLKVNHAPTP